MCHIGLLVAHYVVPIFQGYVYCMVSLVSRPKLLQLLFGPGNESVWLVLFPSFFIFWGVGRQDWGAIFYVVS